MTYRYNDSSKTECHQWSKGRNCLPFRSNRVHLRFLVGFALLNLQYSLQCFIIVSFSFWSLYFRSDFRFMTTPLVCSNFSKGPTIYLLSWLFYHTSMEKTARNKNQIIIILDMRKLFFKSTEFFYYIVVVFPYLRCNSQFNDVKIGSDIVTKTNVTQCDTWLKTCFRYNV